MKRFRERELVRCWVLLCGSLAGILLSGCAEKKVRAYPWATAVLVRPNPPVQQAAATADAADIAPNFPIETPANAGRILAAHPVPPRPRVATPQTAEIAPATKSSLLVPEMSPQETAAAKAQVNDSVAIVERNMALARGKNLTSAQADILSKITGFLSEAREASSEGDWARARNLAKKAQILSEDLAASL